MVIPQNPIFEGIPQTTATKHRTKGFPVRASRTSFFRGPKSRCEISRIQLYNNVLFGVGPPWSAIHISVLHTSVHVFSYTKKATDTTWVSLGKTQSIRGCKANHTADVVQEVTHEVVPRPTVHFGKESPILVIQSLGSIWWKHMRWQSLMPHPMLRCLVHACLRATMHPESWTHRRNIFPKMLIGDRFDVPLAGTPHELQSGANSPRPLTGSCMTQCNATLRWKGAGHGPYDFQ